MILHSILLVLMSLSAIIASIPYDWAPRFNAYTWTIVPVVDLISQLLISYICYTLGASVQRFDCFLIDDGQGGISVRYQLKDEVPQAIGEAHYSDTTDNSILLTDNSSRNSLGNSVQSLWRNRNRNTLSMYNQRCCDVIVQQFLQVTESTSSIGEKTSDSSEES